MRTARVNPAQGGEAFKTNSRYCAHGPKTGAASGFRTRDIELGRLAFCQLNYRRFTETAHSLFGQGWEVDLSASRFTLTTERPKRCFARHVLRRTSLTNNGQQPLARDFVVHGLSPHRHAEHNGEQQKWPHEEKARHGSHRLGWVAFGGLALERVNELQQLQRVVGAVRDCAALPARQARLRYAGTLGDLGLTEAVRVAQGLDKICGCRVHARILYAVA